MDFKPIPEDRFTVLSLDGGGVKGVITSGILRSLEESLNRVDPNGPKNVSERFDLICGTSVGGIIALALASGRSAHDVHEHLCAGVGEAFPKHFYTRLRSLFFPKYSGAGLRALVERFFRQDNKSDTLTLKQLRQRVMVTSVALQDAKPRFHKSDYFPSLVPRAGESVVEVAMATAAAPTYFPAVRAARVQQEKRPIETGRETDGRTQITSVSSREHSIGPPHSKAAESSPDQEPKTVGAQSCASDDRQPSEGLRYSNYLIDGGLVCNNPALAGYIEAKRILGYEREGEHTRDGKPTRTHPRDEQIYVVSVGTGLLGCKPYDSKRLADGGARKWIGRPIWSKKARENSIWEILMDSQSQLVDWQMHFLLNNQQPASRYLRINPALRFAIEMDDAKRVPDLRNYMDVEDAQLKTVMRFLGIKESD